MDLTLTIGFFVILAAIFLSSVGPRIQRNNKIKHYDEYIEMQIATLQGENKELRDRFYQSQNETIEARKAYLDLEKLFNTVKLDLEQANERIGKLQKELDQLKNAAKNSDC